MLFGVKDELQTTVAGWYSMGCVTVQTRARVFQIFRQAFAFLLRL